MEIVAEPLPYPPIGAYGLISDAHSAALVSRDGSVDWCCFHRFDARPAFARILDWRKGGYCRIAPTAPYRTSRRYLPGTNVLETTFETAAGRVRLIDCLPVHPAGRDGRARPYHQLLRLVRGEAGAVEVEVQLSPRFDFGRTVPRVELRAEDAGVAYGGADALAFQSTIPLTRTGPGDASGRATLHAGEEAVCAITYMLPQDLHLVRCSREEIHRRLEQTVAFWSAWAAACAYDGPYREAVQRSALVLKALTNAPTGAIVAAPTTSLPEQIGGTRNWDYRYTWLRDAALTLYALFTLGYTEEAHAFMGWLVRTTAGRAEDLQIMYGVGGERLIPEVELTGLEGYRGSRPVRIGNAAADQFQLDVYGYLADTAWLYHRHRGELDPVFWEFLQGVVDVVERLWLQPDRGIWEIRGAPRHFVSSKVMAWVAVDRAIRLARALGLPAPLARWRALRRRIRTWIETEGVDRRTGAFAQSAGSPEVDASLLLVPLVRFLPAHDPRVAATVERVRAELTHDGLVYRYRNTEHDGVGGPEGTFVICTFWLVDALAMLGRLEEARALFERLLGYTNDLGLLAEELDPHTGEALGNFPQAFSHVGLIGAAMNLLKATRAAVRVRTAAGALTGEGEAPGTAAAGEAR